MSFTFSLSWVNLPLRNSYVWMWSQIRKVKMLFSFCKSQLGLIYMKLIISLIIIVLDSIFVSQCAYMWIDQRIPWAQFPWLRSRRIRCDKTNSDAICTTNKRGHHAEMISIFRSLNSCPGYRLLLSFRNFTKIHM